MTAFGEAIRTARSLHRTLAVTSVAVLLYAFALSSPALERLLALQRLERLLSDFWRAQHTQHAKEYRTGSLFSALREVFPDAALNETRVAQSPPGAESIGSPYAVLPIGSLVNHPDLTDPVLLTAFRFEQQSLVGALTRQKNKIGTTKRPVLTSVDSITVLVPESLSIPYNVKVRFTCTLPTGSKQEFTVPEHDRDAPLRGQWYQFGKVSFPTTSAGRDGRDFLRSFFSNGPLADSYYSIQHRTVAEVKDELAKVLREGDRSKAFQFVGVAVGVAGLKLLIVVPLALLGLALFQHHHVCHARHLLSADAVDAQVLPWLPLLVSPGALAYDRVLTVGVPVVGYGVLAYRTLGFHAWPCGYVGVAAGFWVTLIAMLYWVARDVSILRMSYCAKLGAEPVVQARK